MGITAVDSSLLIPAVAPWHAEHAHADRTLAQIGDLRVIDHVVLETYSFLTRNRPRTPPQVAASLLRALPRPFMTLSADGYLRILGQVATASVMGGAIYDALIGATALEADARLLSRDVRAASTYQAIGVEFELV